MKKLTILPVIALILGVMTMMTSFSKNKNLDSVTGVIELYGNEPFSYPCIKDGEGKIYTIIASDEVIKDILKNPGYKMTFNGHIQQGISEEAEIDGKKFVHNASKNGFFEVESFSVIK